MGSPGDTTLLRRIRSEAPQARVIVYSGYVSLLDDGELGAEADAYIEKGDDEHALVAMIRAVAARLELELAHVRALRLEGHVQHLRPAGGGAA